MTPPTPRPSPLRQVRADRGLTLEQVCADLDHRSRTGSSGVTPSMLSGWERGRRTTSRRYRELLTDYYGRPAEELFAHQDGAVTAGNTSCLVNGPRGLREAMREVARTAASHLAVTGSRSRDVAYLKTIEKVLAARPELVHYRLLFGPPRNRVLHAHLGRLLEVRDPEDRSLGMKTLHIGLIRPEQDMPERFFVASERAAVVPIPSLTSAYGFDSGVLLGPPAAERLLDHARQCYAAATRVESLEALHGLLPAPSPPRDRAWPTSAPLPPCSEPGSTSTRSWN
ncbi:helix-turn-helix domain-containing protein [Nocardiopsis alba]|uniref:helix-turn-helix domain-containing protein n=1 Tax=Nocardiopsis alba TaxID=53437 RepID=UPI0033B63323